MLKLEKSIDSHESRKAGKQYTGLPHTLINEMIIYEKEYDENKSKNKSSNYTSPRFKEKSQEQVPTIIDRSNVRLKEEQVKP